MMSSTDEDAYRHFKETLEADLRQNIKPVIISLTMLAEDYKQSSQFIAKSIEEYIIHVPAEIKILGLYLMDSIMKNLKYTTDYTTIFEKSVVNLFIKVFECVDEQNRKALYRLRQTWNDVFSNQILYEIDVSVKKIDPAWPITANLSSSKPQTQQVATTRTNNSESLTYSSSSSTILINQTNIINPSLNSQTVNNHHHQQQHITNAITSQTSNNAIKKTNGSSTSNHHTNTTIVTTTNNINTSNNSSGSGKTTSQESIKQLQTSSVQNNNNTQQLRTSPTSTNANTTSYKKGIESNSLKKMNTIAVHQSSSMNESESVAKTIVRDPRLANQRTKTTIVTKSDQQPMDTSSSPPATATSNNNNNLKKKLLTTQQNDNNKHLNNNGLKRSSPSSSSIQNIEVKKVKLTPPATSTNSENIKTSPVKSTNTSTISNPSPIKPQLSHKVSPTNNSNNNSKSQITNKVSKIIILTEGEIDESKLNKQSTANGSSSLSDKSNKSTKNSTSKQENKTASSAATHTTTSTSTTKTINKQDKSTSENNAKNFKSIPSLFDIQTTPNLVVTTTTSATTPTSTINKTKQPVSKQSVTSNQIKSKSNIQQQTITNNKQQTVGTKPGNNTNKKIDSNDRKTTSKSPELTLSKQVNSDSSSIFGNDEDVDERFSYNSNSKNIRIDDLTHQLKKLTDLISTPTTITTPSIPSTTNNLSQPPTVPSVDLIANLFDSNNKLSLEPNVLALITANKQQQQQHQQQQPQLKISSVETLANNKQSLNELEQRLIISKQNDQANNETQTSTTTQEIIEMIRTVIKQQQVLIEQQQQRKENIESHEIINEEIENKNVEMSQEQEHQQEQQEQQQQQQQCDYDQSIVTLDDLPPIKPRDKNENLNDSLLIIDGRSYRIQPEVRRLIKVYYHDHELFCDTRTKEVFVDQKRVYKMGEPTKEIMLNSRRVRLMYMGRRIELWIDGLSYHFRADSPPKQISVSNTNASQQQVKRYYVTIDSRTMDMFFDNYKVCQINGGIHGNGPAKLMVQLAPNDFEMHEISFVCPPKRIEINGQPRTMRYDLPVPCIEMSSGVFHVIRFSGVPREIYIDDAPYMVPFDKTIRIRLNGRAHELAWGGPGFEVIIDGRPYELQFNRPSREIIIGTRPHTIYICGDVPDVKIGGILPYELLSQLQQQQQQQAEQETEQSKIIKSLPSLMEPIPSNDFLMAQQSSSNKQQSSSNKNNKQPDLQELIKNLVDHNLIKPVAKNDKLPSLNDMLKNVLQPKQSQQIQNIETNNSEIEKLPDLTNFEVDALKKTYQGAIQSLYSGHQCATCGNRFNQSDSSRYRKHLDWHFRQNRKEKDEINKAHSRSWYYILQDWIQYEELSEDSANNSGNDGNEKSSGGTGDMNSDENNDNINNNNNNNDNNGIHHSANNNKNSLNSYNNGNGTTTPATDDIDDKCYVCQDPFEIFFHEEKDEWHFKDAIRVHQRVYHPICFEDAREDSSMLINRSSIDDNLNSSMVSLNENNNTNNTSQTNDAVKNEPMRQHEQQTAAVDEPMFESNETVKHRNNQHLKYEPKTP